MFYEDNDVLGCIVRDGKGILYVVFVSGLKMYDFGRCDFM